MPACDTLWLLDINCYGIEPTTHLFTLIVLIIHIADNNRNKRGRENLSLSINIGESLLQSSILPKIILTSCLYFVHSTLLISFHHFCSASEFFFFSFSFYPPPSPPLLTNALHLSGNGQQVTVLSFVNKPA